MKNSHFKMKRVIQVVAVVVGVLLNILVLALVGKTPVMGQGNDSKLIEKPLFYYSESCPYSISLIEQLTLQEVDLTENQIFAGANIAEDENETTFRAAIKACGSRLSAVPMLFDGESCFVGDAAVSREIVRIAKEKEIEIDLQTLVEKTNEVTLLDSDGESTDEGNVEVEQVKQPISEEVGEKRNVVQGSLLKFVLSLVAPVVLIGAGYYTIKRFKL